MRCDAGSKLYCTKGKKFDSKIRIDLALGARYISYSSIPVLQN